MRHWRCESLGGGNLLRGGVMQIVWGVSVGGLCGGFVLVVAVFIEHC